MKIILLSLVFFLSIGFTFSQNLSFNLSVHKEEYKEIEDAIIIGENEIPFVFGFGLDQPLHLFGATSVDTFTIIENDIPNVAIGNRDGSTFDVFFPLFIPIINTDIDDRPYSLSYKITGEVGQRTIVFQWKNIIPENDIDNDYLNLQLRINEASNTVDYIYGPYSSKTNIKLGLSFDRLPLLSSLIAAYDETKEEETPFIFFGR